MVVGEGRIIKGVDSQSAPNVGKRTILARISHSYPASLAD